MFPAIFFPVQRHFVTIIITLSLHIIEDSQEKKINKNTQYTQNQRYIRRK